MENTSHGYTILQQLGNGKFITMTGARDIMTDNKSLTMKLGRGANRGINFVKITVDERDTYTVQFFKCSWVNFSSLLLAEFRYVGVENLRGVFERTTGLATSL